MPTNTAKLVHDARIIGNLSVRTMAALSGVAPSTISRIERGTVEPLVSTFETILSVAGYSYDPLTNALVGAPADMEAVRAARLLVNPRCGIEPTPASREWTDKFRAAGLVSGDGLETKVDADEVCYLVGRLAKLARRKGGRKFAMTDWRLVARALRDSNMNWAMTGAYPATRYTNITWAVWPVFYVEDVDRAAEAADLTPSEHGLGVNLLPLDDITCVGGETLKNGLRVADPWQIAIDCYAGGSRLPDQAEEIIKKMAAA